MLGLKVRCLRLGERGLLLDAGAIGLTLDDFLAAILFTEEYGVLRAALVPYAIVEQRAKFIVRTNSHKFILHVEGGPPFELSKENPDRLVPVYDFIFQFIKARYENSFSEFLLKGDASRRFGF